MAAPKVNLPQNYLKWLDSILDGSFVNHNDREWGITDRQDLLEPFELNEGDIAPYIEQARLYAEMIEDVTGETTTVDDEDNEIPYSRIKKWLTIAEGDEDLLCVDPNDDYSVWIFAPNEGGYVEKVCDSIDQFLEELEVV
ncbi:MAG: hypothetical protein KDA77_18930 [Planctomycetaceae bacterium]|nr:hypothetical protein [Planctomycetaceae bacterium]